MRLGLLPLSLSLGLSAVLAASAALADEPPEEAAPAPAPVAPAPVAPAPAALPPAAPWFPPNVTTTPDGGVTVTRTPQQGVDVHAPTESGTVHAYSCSRVTVDPPGAPPSAAPPCPPAYYPYPAYAYGGGPYVTYGAYYTPYAAPYPYVPPAKPKYAADPGRRAALIASSLVFGLGTAAAGTAYLASAMPEGCPTFDGCHAQPSKGALYAMGGIMTVTPSLPRFVVGDVGMGLLFTALRGGSFAAGAFIDWKDPSHVLPATFAFVVPATLAIVDLATTPHREQLEPKPAHRDARLTLQGLGPSAIVDKAGSLAPSLAASGTFL